MSDASTYDYHAEQVQAAHDYLMRDQLPDNPLIRELVDAAIAAADRSGIGSDRVWEIARQIKALRASR